METSLTQIVRKDPVKSLPKTLGSLGYKTKGWQSEYNYKKYMSDLRKERPQNVMFKTLILTALKEKEKNLFWLSKQTGILDQSMYLYAKGINLPNMDALDRIWQVLDLDYKFLDFILGE